MSKKSQSNTTTNSATAMMVNPAIEFYQFNLLSTYKHHHQKINEMHRRGFRSLKDQYLLVQSGPRSVGSYKMKEGYHLTI